LDAARQEQQQALEQMGLAAPDWGAAAAQLDRAAESYTSALAQAHEDVRAHEQLVAQLNEARLRGNRVNELLRANTADRPRAAQRFQAGWQSLERIARESQQPQADWAQLLGLLKEAMQDFEKAEQFAQEDIRLAQQAAAALADAERAYHAARTFYSHGVSAEAGSAGTRLSQAQGQLAAQAYEQAIELAAQAEQTARGACEEAQRQVDRKLRQQEEERRRREQLAAQAAAAAAASLASQFAQAQPASPPAVAPTSSAPAAPPSTWPATSSQSSWSSSSSQSSW
jgi:hypothetical protein